LRHTTTTAAQLAAPVPESMDTISHTTHPIINLFDPGDGKKLDIPLNAVQCYNEEN
jgi:hypothetical protein